MDRRIGYIIIALLSALLFFLAVGYHSWPCGGSPLSQGCIRYKVYETTGALILTAGLLIFICGIFLIIVLVMDETWAEITSTVFAILAAIIAIAGVFYYYERGSEWGPFIATIGMSLTTALAAILLFDLITALT